MQPAVPFVLVVPGLGPISSFNFNNQIYHTDLFNPSLISSICISLTQPIPQNYALSIYFSQPPYSQMQYLGALSNNRPSDIFSTGFPLKHDITILQSVKICIKLQHFDELRDLVLVNDGKRQYSKLVAQNLYNFMMSFDNQNLLQNNIKGEYLVVPSNFLLKWLNKFEQKYTKDPNFILKTTIN